MGKKLLIIAVAMLGMVACTNEYLGTPDSNTGKDGRVRFKVAVNNMTKGNPYLKTTGEDLVIPAVASLYHADGTSVLPSVFYTATDRIDIGYITTDNASSGYCYLAPSSGSYNDAFVLPLGDMRLDVLAFAMSEEDYDSYLSSLSFYYLEGGYSSSSWDDIRTNGWGSPSDAGWNKPVFSDKDNYTKKVEFINVDTWNYPADLMYASANNLSRENPVGNLLFKHTNAAVIFNVFCGPAPSNDIVKLKNILFIDPDYDNNGDMSFYQSGELANGTKLRYALEHDGTMPEIDDELNQITLKTVGTLTIDNSRYNLTAKWTTPKAYLENYRSEMKNHYTFRHDEGILSPFNTENITLHSSGSVSYQSAEEFYIYNEDNNQNYQYGDPLMLPVQPVANAYLWYQIERGPSAGYYLYDLNLPRGTWQAGHVYIYNLYLSFSDAKFTVEVEPWDFLADDFNFDYLENWDYLSSGTVEP